MHCAQKCYFREWINEFCIMLKYYDLSGSFDWFHGIQSKTAVFFLIAVAIQF